MNLRKTATLLFLFVFLLPSQVFAIWALDIKKCLTDLKLSAGVIEPSHNNFAIKAHGNKIQVEFGEMISKGESINLEQEETQKCVMCRQIY